jgi:hypothetical protein
MERSITRYVTIDRSFALIRELTADTPRVPQGNPLPWTRPTETIIWKYFRDFGISSNALLGKLFCIHDLLVLVLSSETVRLLTMSQTSILEDFALLSTGVPASQLPGYSSGVILSWEEHKAHCFNYVRQALMCFADPTTEGRAEDNPHRVAESGVIRVCNDFEGLLDWDTQPDRKLPNTWKVSD